MQSGSCTTDALCDEARGLRTNRGRCESDADGHEKGKPMSLTPKQEKFAQEVASGKSQADAYRAALEVVDELRCLFA